MGAQSLYLGQVSILTTRHIRDLLSLLLHQEMVLVALDVSVTKYLTNGL